MDPPDSLGANGKDLREHVINWEDGLPNWFGELTVNLNHWLLGPKSEQ